MNYVESNQKAWDKLAYDHHQYYLKKLLDAFSSNQLFIETFEEYDRCVPGMGGDTPVEEGLATHRHFEGKLPIHFSLWASHR